MAYGPLAHGLLTGAFTRSTTFDESDWRASGVIFGQPLLTGENRGRNLDVVDRLAGIAASGGMTLPQLALSWVLANPAVSVALVGARTPAEIEDAAAAAARLLDASHLRQINDAMADAAGMVPALSAQQ
jgi:aryl-alcohol dehydrogenase-like predicted oxidoreductase